MITSLPSALGAPTGPTSVVVHDYVRVTAISPAVVRVEPKGPTGFEDRTTFMVTARDMSQALPISQKTTADGTMLWQSCP